MGSTKADFAVCFCILVSAWYSLAYLQIKSGGHSPNPGFSSTKGVLVALHRIGGVIHDSASQTAVIGTGMIWDDVYKALEPHGVSVLGARAPGIGVGGFLLGGGTDHFFT